MDENGLDCCRQTKWAQLSHIVPGQSFRHKVVHDGSCGEKGHHKGLVLLKDRRKCFNSVRGGHLFFLFDSDQFYLIRGKHAHKKEEEVACEDGHKDNELGAEEQVPKQGIFISYKDFERGLYVDFLDNRTHHEDVKERASVANHLLGDAFKQVLSRADGAKHQVNVRGYHQIAQPYIVWHTSHMLVFLS